MPPPTTTPHLRRRQTVTLILLFAAGLINFFDRASLSLANTQVRADLHLDATQMGWLLSAFSLAYGFAQLPLIGLLDRLGTRLVLGAGLGLWSVAQMLTGAVTGLPSFLVLRAALGAGEAPFYPAAIRTIREWFSANTRARATAVMSSSQTFALAIAPPVLTVLLLRVGWRGMFVVLGVLGLLVALAWVALHRPAPVEPGSPALQGLSLGAALRVLLRQRTVWGMMLGWGGVNYTAWLYLAWLPGYLQEQRHVSVARTGWLAAIPFLAGAVGMLLSGFLADARVRHGTPVATVHRQQIIPAMLLSATATFAVAHAAGTPQAVAGISFALFFIHFAGTSGWGLVQAVSPVPLVASLGALQNFASFLIASAAPVLTGFLLDRTHSFTLALVVCSAVTVLGALSYATLTSSRELQLTVS